MRIMIGIPCYSSVSPETLEDYMRFAYYLGRNTEHEYFLGIRTKQEQYRARNEIVEQAITLDCDYLLFLDDDHVINWEDSFQPNSRYGFVDKFINYLQDEKTGIVGGLYYHRGGDCRPVLMKEGKDGGYYYMRDDELKPGLMEVAVQGGGFFMIDMNIITRVPSPWFEAESKAGLGTDIQICQKVREAGFKVCCDTNTVVGHVMTKRQTVTPKNRHRIISENGQIGNESQGMDQHYSAQSAYNMYRLDAAEYLGRDNFDELQKEYWPKMAAFNEYDDPKDYYSELGTEQLARQVWFHGSEAMLEQMQIALNLINTNHDAQGIDYGCGSSPLGFELLSKGHRMDFVDVDGAGGYEFLKWRVDRRNLQDKAGFKAEGPYDYALFLDSIEHFKNWKEILTEVCSKIVDNGFIFTNYFFNEDFENIEHISMDHDAVKEHLISMGFYPTNEMVWIKRDFSKIGKTEAA